MAESDISPRDHGRSPTQYDAALTHALSLILRVCHIAGTAAFIDEAGLGPEGMDLRKAIRGRNTAALFDHLVAALSPEMNPVKFNSFQDLSDKYTAEGPPWTDMLEAVNAIAKENNKKVDSLSVISAIYYLRCNTK
jgi:hypothetical protein